MLRSLAPDGDIARIEAALDQVSLSAVPVPRSIRNSVQRRLKEVSPAARQVVSLAAVAGIQFDSASCKPSPGWKKTTFLP